MYVTKEANYDRTGYPQNYNGSLLEDKSEEACSHKEIKPKKYIVKRNASIGQNNAKRNARSGSTDDLILIGALAFLYIGCEHTKENWILMAALAYLLLLSNND